MRSSGEEAVEDVIEAVTEVVEAEADASLSVSICVSAVLALSALVATFLAPDFIQGRNNGSVELLEKN